MAKKFTILWLGIGVTVLFGAVHYGLNSGSLLPSILTGSTSAVAQETGTAKVVFVVHCYDEGNDALKGLKGIRKVDKGFRRFREINTVYYDPNVITIEEMEKALKSAGTYRGTLRE
jgi:copper chaperone CopZ